jgi:hypothetical protein
MRSAPHVRESFFVVLRGREGDIIPRMPEQNAKDPKTRYRWPWFLLAAVILAIVLAVIWMSVAVRRVREYRKPEMPSVPAQTTSAETSRTNASPAP